MIEKFIRTPMGIDRQRTKMKVSVFMQKVQLWLNAEMSGIRRKLKREREKISKSSFMRT